MNWIHLTDPFTGPYSSLLSWIDWILHVIVTMDWLDLTGYYYHGLTVASVLYYHGLAEHIVPYCHGLTEPYCGLTDLQVPLIVDWLNPQVPIITYSLTCPYNNGLNGSYRPLSSWIDWTLQDYGLTRLCCPLCCYLYYQGLTRLHFHIIMDWPGYWVTVHYSIVTFLDLDVKHQLKRTKY